MHVERLFEHLEQLEYAGEWPPRVAGSGCAVVLRVARREVRFISRTRLIDCLGVGEASMAPSQRRQGSACPQGTTLGSTLGFMNYLVAAGSNRQYAWLASQTGSVSSRGRRALVAR